MQNIGVLTTQKDRLKEQLKELGAKVRIQMQKRRHHDIYSGKRATWTKRICAGCRNVNSVRPKPDRRAIVEQLGCERSSPFELAALLSPTYL